MKLVLLPGMDGSGNLFEEFVSYCDCDWQIIPLPKEGDQSYPKIAGKIKDRLPNEEDYVLLAESFSGGLVPLLLSVANKKPIAVIFVSSFLHTPMPLLIRLFKILPLAKLIKLPGAKLITRYFCMKGSSKNAFTTFWHQVKQLDFDVIKKRLKAIQNITDLNYKMNMPVLVLMAKDDKVVANNFVSRSIHLLPKVHVRIFDGPHCILQSKPQQTAKLVMDFMHYVYHPNDSV